MRTYFENINADFTCKHCGILVSACSGLSGVINRNHCPYCLYSRHLDLFEAGDRLSACKALMVPIGLTLKKSRDKYAKGAQGELMLVHWCERCERISINRIAADDDPILLMEVFDKCFENQKFFTLCENQGIHLLQKNDRSEIQTRLYGSNEVIIQEDLRLVIEDGMSVYQ